MQTLLCVISKWYLYLYLYANYKSQPLSYIGISKRYVVIYEADEKEVWKLDRNDFI